MTRVGLTRVAGMQFSITHPDLRTQNGSGVSIAVIDSGVHARHPHVGGVAGGVGVNADGTLGDDYVDRIGHGTAVTAAIKERVPEARVYAVRVFENALLTTAEALIRGIRWALQRNVDIINLSLGTSKTDRAPRFHDVMDVVVESDVWLISAAAHDGEMWLPGSMSGAVGVVVDWDCDRDTVRVQTTGDGSAVFAASGYPRSIPGVPVERNLRGVSFAVANTTALLARVRQGRSGTEPLGSALIRYAAPG